jgi:hypothetical protein
MVKAIKDFFGALLGMIIILLVCALVVLTSGCSTYQVKSPEEQLKDKAQYYKEKEHGDMEAYYKVLYTMYSK